MYRVRDREGSFKYTGRSRARVIDNRDPDNTGKIRLFHPLLGDTVWVDYLRTPGHFTVPSIGDVVYIECDCGEPEYPVAWGNVITGTKDAPNMPEEFRRDVPTNRGMFSPNGHLIEVDDGIATLSNDPNDTNFTTEKRGIRITSKAGNKIHISEDDDASQQFILLEDVNGNSIKLDYTTNKITIKSLDSTQFDTTGDRTDTVGGNKTETVGGDLTISVEGNVNLSCSDATVDASGNIAATAGGNVEVTATGNAEVTAALIQLNGATGDVLTTVTDPVIDSIFGVPTTGVPTVKSG